MHGKKGDRGKGGASKPRFCWALLGLASGPACARSCDIPGQGGFFEVEEAGLVKVGGEGRRKGVPVGRFPRHAIPSLKIGT